MSQRSSDVPMKGGVTFRFGEITFDAGRRQVFRGPHEIQLTPRAYRLLEFLLARRPQAVSKEEILEAVWSQTFVTEGSLSALVKDLRKALGEDARTPSLIRTVFGFGYAFQGTVQEVEERTPSTHRHRLVWSGTDLLLSEGPNVIGREPPAGIWICHPSVSREHARIVVTEERAAIEDLGSKNGTWRGETAVNGPLPLADGDEVRVGAVRLTYRGPGAACPGKTATYK